MSKNPFPYPRHLTPSRFDMSQEGYSITTSGPVDRPDDTQPVELTQDEKLSRKIRTREKREAIPPEDSFDGHYVNERKERTRVHRMNREAGSDFDAGCDWRAREMNDYDDRDRTTALDRLFESRSDSPRYR